DGINQLSDATGVQASITGTNLILKSTDFGSNAFVSARPLSGSFTTGDGNNNKLTRAEGTDASVRINGLQATGNRNQISLNSATLNLEFSLDTNLANNTALSFTVDGGGANFQLGPDVVSSQQARLGIQSVSTSELGGSSGKLFELKSGGTKSLSADTRG